MLVATPYTPEATAVGRLVAIAEAQAEAITRCDVEQFQHLLDQRAEVQRAVEAADLRDAASFEALRHVAEIDMANISRVTEMIEETSRSLDDLHRGRIALNGYSGPGATPGQRGSILDRMR